MQQDLKLVMEKKPIIRANQPPAKGQGAEAKKNQDISNNKPWPRSARSNYGPNPKPPPQRNKNFSYDKRPRPRSGQVGGKTDARLEYEQPEHGSVMKYGIKKQSLNHLLNFHYTPRTSNGPGTYGRQYHQKGKVHYPKYNKEHYLQANCQFIVKEGVDYTSSLNNPDALVDWAYIEQIMVKSEDQPSCPICLEKPLAGRMTRCGHIYCYPCILHYLALSDKPWRKCPICYEAVHLKDLKSVCWVPIASFAVNDTITLKLMRRPRGSMRCWPFESGPLLVNHNNLPNVNDGPLVVQYCKLLQADAKQVLEMIDMDITELNQAWKLEENTPEACFIQQAIELLKTSQEEKLRDVSEVKIHKSEGSVSSGIDFVGEKLRSVDIDQCDGDGGCYHDQLHCGSDDHNFEMDYISESEGLKDPVPFHLCDNDKDFYFYQASDGQHIYLAGLCARVLEHSYGGSLAACPKTITATVEAREVLTLTEGLRKRLNYLQHLPITCQIELVELNLQPPTVTAESLAFYHDRLEARRKSRIRKCREETRRDLQITREQERKQGFPISEPLSTQKAVRIDSESDFPLYGSPPSAGLASSSNDFQEPNSSYDALSSSPGPSFATMLTMVKSPTQSGFVRPTKQAEPPQWVVLPSRQHGVSSDSEQQNKDNDENYIPAPSYTQSFHDAISQAMERSCQASNTSSKDNTTKKNKKKKQILFATGMNFQV